jgi:hypothetical protein
MPTPTPEPLDAPETPEECNEREPTFIDTGRRAEFHLPAGSAWQPRAQPQPQPRPSPRLQCRRFARRVRPRPARRGRRDEDGDLQWLRAVVRDVTRVAGRRPRQLGLTRTTGATTGPAGTGWDVRVGSGRVGSGRVGTPVRRGPDQFHRGLRTSIRRAP